MPLVYMRGYQNFMPFPCLCMLCQLDSVLVSLLRGLNKDFKAKFVKHFDKIDPQVGVEKYRDEVKSGIFPSQEHSFDYLDDELLDKLY